MVKESVYRPYRRTLGKSAWSSALQRVVNPVEPIDFLARESFEGVWPINALLHPEWGPFLWQLIPLPPREAAVRLLHFIARSLHGYSGGYRAFYDEARSARRRRSLQQT